jgi:hypothetical protein
MSLVFLFVQTKITTERDPHEKSRMCDEYINYEPEF